MTSRKGSSGEILIVEDNPATMALAIFLLQSAGHTVISAIDAEAGLTLARAERPGLILLDIQLAQLGAATALPIVDPHAGVGVK